MRNSQFLEKIISGGQTGADRAGLDFALAHAIPHGGWCPKGRLAEDGTISQGYKLEETPTAYPDQRTEWNVRDSDGTAIFSVAADLNGGSKLTAVLAQKQGKPCLHISAGDSSSPEDALVRFVQRNKIRVLNIAGPRASEEPAVDKFVRRTLEKAFENCPD